MLIELEVKPERLSDEKYVRGLARQAAEAIARAAELPLEGVCEVCDKWGECGEQTLEALALNLVRAAVEDAQEEIPGLDGEQVAKTGFSWEARVGEAAFRLALAPLPPLCPEGEGERCQLDEVAVGTGRTLGPIAYGVCRRCGMRHRRTAVQPFGTPELVPVEVYYRP